jgi:outer membrane receptor protein involved in Fe transport
MNPRRNTHRRELQAILLTLIAGLLPLLAGQASGQLHIDVKDPSGAAVAASGNLTNTGTGVVSHFETDPQGGYTFSSLPAGRYRLEVSKPGFATQSTTVQVGNTAAARTITLALATQVSRIDVVGQTPIPGTDIPIDQVPGNVQTASARDLEQLDALSLDDLLNKSFGSVHINENQGNPFQPDLNFRGYTASPLLGTPEGISVYMDGVRQNQPLGDVVGWDLIPKIAISEIALMPGSNPMFGLNTMGGAVSLQTKDGLSAPGGSLQIQGGSWGRFTGSGEYGGSTKSGFNYYFAGTLFTEDGWRQFSPSKVRQGFGKIGQRWKNGYVSLGFSYADNFLAGDGVQDGRFLAQHYNSVYTVEDAFWNHSPSLTLNAGHQVNSALTLSGNAYFRYIRSDTVNPNLSNNSYDESLYNLSAGDIAALTAAGYSGFPTTGNATTEPFPYWRCLGEAYSHNEPIEKCDANVTREWTHEHNYGVSGQATLKTRRNSLTLGAAFDGSGITFQQAVQYGYLNPDRVTITLIPFFEDGTNNSNDIPVDGRVNLHGVVRTPSVYFTDTLNLGRFTFTVSGRYNHEHLQNFDRIGGSILGSDGSDGGRGSLNGDYVFQRFNPSAGLAFNSGRFATLYFNYSEASRAPTTIELGCADPNYPCTLPNALSGDPPLNQVVTRTFEAGARGVMNSLRWNADYFFSQNYNDLLFVSSNTTGLGYFMNFGKTRRDGVEFNVSRQFHHFSLGGNYTFQNVTYQSPQSIDGGSNSANDSAVAGFPGVDDNIEIAPGNFIPQIPRNIGKAFAEFNATSKFAIDLDVIGVGRSYARGNENNLDQQIGPYYLGPGYSAGYVVANLGAHYNLERHLRLFVQVNNVLDHRYYTAALLGNTPFDNNYNFIARPFPAYTTGPQAGNYPLRSSTFFAPGAPIGAWGGLKFTF